MGNAKSLPCTAGPPITGFRYPSIWQVLEGIPTPEQSTAPLGYGQAPYRSFLVHKFDKKAAAASHTNAAGKPEVPPLQLEQAKNAMRRMKMLRHPYILRFVVRGCVGWVRGAGRRGFSTTHAVHA